MKINIKHKFSDKMDTSHLGDNLTISLRFGRPALGYRPEGIHLSG